MFALSQHNFIEILNKVGFFLIKKKTKKTLNIKNTKNVKNPERQTPVDPRDTAKTNDSTDNQTVLNTSKNVPIDIKKTSTENDNSIIFHVAQVEFADGTIVQKMFRVDKMPTHAVLVMYSQPKKIGALDCHHVLTYSKSEKLCKSHKCRILKQYVGSDATIENRYTSQIEIVAVRDLGMPTSDLDPNFTEDRSWERAKNAAAAIALAAKNPTALSAAAVALNTAVLTNYVS